MDMPLLTLGIPTFNRRKWLKACLEAAIPQAEALPAGQVEILVSDNAGDDGTWDLLEELAAAHPCLRRHRNAQNLGTANFDVVVREARGKYVWLMGDDDAPVPGAFARLLDLVQTAPRDLYLLHCQEVDLEGRPTIARQWFNDLPRLDWDLAERADFKAYMHHAQYMACAFAFLSILVVRRAGWMEAGPRLEEFDQIGYTHLARAMQMTRRWGKVRVVPEVLLTNTSENDRYESDHPWERALMDLKGWLRLGEAFFRDDRELLLAFMEPLRRNRQPYLIHHLRFHAPSPAEYGEARALMLEAGIPELAIAAHEYGGKLLEVTYKAPPGLAAGSLCLADLGLVTRGARRMVVFTGRDRSGEFERLLADLQAQSVARLQVLCAKGSPLPRGTARVAWQAVDLVRVANDDRHRQACAETLRSFAPDLVLNLDPERRPSWDLLAGSLEPVAALAFRAPERPVDAKFAAWLDSFYSLLVPRGPLAGLRALLGLEPDAAESAALPAETPLPASVPVPAVLPVRWEGSQFVYHSLAHVNRQLCLGLLGSGRVELSLVPYEPDQFDGAASREFRPLAAQVGKVLSAPAQVHVRHQWPPSAEPPAEGAWVIVQPWEYGGIPQEWVPFMRDRVDEVWVPSTWLKDCYVRSGIPAGKVVVVPNGVDCSVFRPDGERFPLRTRKGCKFLFLGGTIGRKGFDLLLAAYRQAFRAEDDVCLVVKGQGGGVYRMNDPGPELVRVHAQDPEAPELEYRDDNLTQEQMAALYRSCDALVLPYRGEGFGLPIAEAMASGLPVIVTAAGAACDFVREAWAYLVPSRPVPIPAPPGFTPSRAGFWLEEPDLDALVAQLRRAAADPAERRAKGLRGREYAAAELAWDRPVALVLDRLAELAGRTPRRFAPAAPEAEVGPDAFLYRPDWTRAEWVEVLLSFLLAFRPGEPVVLVLAWSGQAGEPALAAVQTQVLKMAKGAGLEQFADVALVDQPDDLAGYLAGCAQVTAVPPGRGAVQGLTGLFGRRLAEARTRLCQNLPG
jgi:glycosyltransferase involved in cell wall biosynthesis